MKPEPAHLTLARSIAEATIEDCTKYLPQYLQLIKQSGGIF
jgi:hypothetical protein